MRQCTTLSEYRDIFDAAGPQNQLIGEASVYYLYSKLAIHSIYKFSPNAKLIVMLRNPVDLIYSLYYQYLTNGTENAPDFKTAWAWQDDRLSGRKLPYKKDIALTQYAKIGKLGEQVDRAMNIFPKDQIHFIFYEDFSSETNSVYQKALDFLGAEPTGSVDLEIVNAGARPRIRSAQRLIRKLAISDYGMRANRVVKSLLNVERTNIANTLRTLNSDEGYSRPPLSRSFTLHLINTFDSDIHRLERLTGRDLSHWRTQ